MQPGPLGSPAPSRGFPPRGTSGIWGWESVKKRNKHISELVARVSRITSTSKTINSEPPRASHLPHGQKSCLGDFHLLHPSLLSPKGDILVHRIIYNFGLSGLGVRNRKAVPRTSYSTTMRRRFSTSTCNVRELGLCLRLGLFMTERIHQSAQLR